MNRDYSETEQHKNLCGYVTSYRNIRLMTNDLNTNGSNVCLKTKKQNNPSPQKSELIGW